MKRQIIESQTWKIKFCFPRFFDVPGDNRKILHKSEKALFRVRRPTKGGKQKSPSVKFSKKKKADERTG